ncbi:hypothetical protein [Niabella aquatica]
MIKSHLKTAWRNIVRRKLYTSLNIIGLVAAIVCASLLSLFISLHYSFYRYHKNASTTYKIVNEIHYEKTAYVSSVSVGMYQALLRGNPHTKTTGVMLNNQSA